MLKCYYPGFRCVKENLCHILGKGMVGPACSFLSYLGTACLFGMTTESLSHLEQVNRFCLALPAHFWSYLGPACLFGLTTESLPHLEQVNAFFLFGPACSFLFIYWPCLLVWSDYKILVAFGTSEWFVIRPCLLIFCT